MGRMSKRDEELVMKVVNKSWQMVYDILTKQGRTMKEKEMVALEVAKRTAPKNLDITSKGNELANPVLVKFLNGKTTEDNRNTPGVQEAV